MKNNIYYENAYEKYYKNIPNIVFYVTLALFVIATIVICGIGAYNHEHLPYGHMHNHKELCMDGGDFVSHLFCGCIAGVLSAFINKFVALIMISQKVVVADRLLKLTEKIEDDQ